MTTEILSDFGDACTITSPEGITIDEVPLQGSALDVKASPNPFDTTFSIFLNETANLLNLPNYKINFTCLQPALVVVLVLTR